MSFPNIPNITPSINLTLEDAINLLLDSIALEEISLSKLMDAETSKILCVLKDCEHKDSVLQDAIKINGSVDTTIKNMIKLQMLLQFKLEKVKELLPSSTTTTTTTTSTSTTTTTTFSKSTTTTHTTTSTTTSTTSTRSTTTKRPCRCCCLTGKGKGCISNRCDPFYQQTAVLKAFVNSDIKNRSIRYSIKKDDMDYVFYASAYDIEIKCPCQDCSTVIVCGKGSIEKRSKCNPITAWAKFILTVCKEETGCVTFKMEIKSEASPELNHNSGIVKVENYDINLPLGMYC